MQELYKFKNYTLYETESWAASNELMWKIYKDEKPHKVAWSRYWAIENWKEITKQNVLQLAIVIETESEQDLIPIMMQTIGVKNYADSKLEFPYCILIHDDQFICHKSFKPFGYYVLHSPALRTHCQDSNNNWRPREYEFIQPRHFSSRIKIKLDNNYDNNTFRW